jgi:hypothetical protein
MADETEDAPVGLVSRLLDKVSTRHWILFAGAVLLAIAGLFGGLATVHKEEPELPMLSVGEEYAGAQFSVAVQKLELMDIAPDYSFEADEGNEYLVATITLTNNWVETTTAIKDAIALEFLDKEHSAAERTFLVSDSTPLPQAQPGLPIDVGVVWQVPRGSIADDHMVQVSIMEATLNTKTVLTYGDRWDDPLPVALVELPVHRVVSEREGQ